MFVLKYAIWFIYVWRSHPFLPWWRHASVSLREYLPQGNHVTILRLFFIFNFFNVTRYSSNHLCTSFICAVEYRIDAKDLVLMMCSLLRCHQFLNHRFVSFWKFAFSFRFKCWMEVKKSDLMKKILCVNSDRINLWIVSTWCCFRILFWLSRWSILLDESRANELFKMIMSRSKTRATQILVSFELLYKNSLTDAKRLVVFFMLKKWDYSN